ncbi:hypothetical protein ACFLIN_00595 [Corynebacterium kutscheri]|uniref:hypothetical protein n=1 Tax=Corynebacterium kutscheri TaxID=35755 RepID=UPI0037BEDC67
MFKRSLGIAMSIVGLVVGAGFASGQEMLQYFIAFGSHGLIGAIVASLIMIVSCIAVVQLGSYFRALEHKVVFDKVAHPITARLFDIATIATLFCTGFIMFAGAGSNLNQQFGLAPWIGALIMLVITLLAGMLDVDKVSTVIGAITPFIIVFIVGAGVYAIATSSIDFSELDSFARANLDSTLPNWWISALNYVGMTLIIGASMAIVIGGNNFDPKAAAYGGLGGGIVFSVLLMLIVIALFISIPDVYADDMPMLSIVNQIHPMLGTPMSIVIFGMIFNTAIGMFYALAKRLSANQPSRFRLIFITICLIGFGCSFARFKTLVAVVYPILGYIGIALTVVLIAGWIRDRSAIKEETKRRDRVRRLLFKKHHPLKNFSSKDALRLKKATAASNLDAEDLHKSIMEDLEEVLPDEHTVALPDTQEQK